METILITGASSGIGMAAAKRLAEGNRIILCARNRSAIDAVANNLPNAITFIVDVRNKIEIEQMFLSLERKK